MNDGHECPVIVARITGVKFTRCREVTDHPIRTHKVHTQIASPAMFNVHGHRDMLEALEIGLLQHVFSDFKRNCKSIISLGNILIDMNPGRVIPSLRLDMFECLGSLNGCPAVDLAISKSVAEMLSNGRLLPIARIQVDWHRSLHNQILHISPCEIWPNL